MPVISSFRKLPIREPIRSEAVDFAGLARRRYTMRGDVGDTMISILFMLVCAVILFGGTFYAVRTLLDSPDARKKDPNSAAQR
jgi:hypothetical protein